MTCPGHCLARCLVGIKRSILGSFYTHNTYISRKVVRELDFKDLPDIVRIGEGGEGDAFVGSLLTRQFIFCHATNLMVNLLNVFPIKCPSRKSKEDCQKEYTHTVSFL